MYKEPEFTDLIAKCNELVLYFLIDEMGAFIWRMNHDMSHRRIPKKDHPAIDREIVGVRLKQSLAVEQLVRFEIKPLKDGQATEAYWSWYKMWDGWKKSLTDDEWNDLDKALSRELTDAEVEKYKALATQHAKKQSQAAGGD